MFNYQVVGAVGIHLAQKLIEETYEYARINRKKVIRVSVTSGFFGTSYKIVGSQ